MIINDTFLQPIITLSLLIAGFVYQYIFYFFKKIKINKYVDEIFKFSIVIFGAIIFFTVLFLVGNGEIRLYTILCFILGFYLSTKTNKLLNKMVNKFKTQKK